MKRIIIFLLTVVFSLAFTACGDLTGQNKPKEKNITVNSDTGNVLVVYFSATGTTKQLAEYTAELLNADIYEITPKDPYTEKDLAYYTDSRADKEQNDPSARPEITESVPDMEKYSTVVLGYPIWHGQAPRIINTFLESYNFEEKIILPFCTSHSSDIGSSDKNLHSLAENAKWLDGKRFSEDSSKDEISDWLIETGILVNKAADNAFDFESRTVLLNSGHKMPINGLGTYSLHGEECINSVKSALKSGVRLIDTASAYGNEKEVGQAIREAIHEGIIKREDVFVITKIYPGSEMETPEKSIQDCLERLDIGYVDMMLLHHPDKNDDSFFNCK